MKKKEKNVEKETFDFFNWPLANFPLLSMKRKEKKKRKRKEKEREKKCAAAKFKIFFLLFAFDLNARAFSIFK